MGLIQGGPYGMVFFPPVIDPDPQASGLNSRSMAEQGRNEKVRKKFKIKLFIQSSCIFLLCCVCLWFFLG